MKRAITQFLTVFSFFSALSQNALKSYQWRDHLPYNRAYSVTSQGNKIMAVANECAFAFNKGDGSYERLNKVYGFSDVEPAVIKNNPFNNAVLVIYKNSNIDVYKDGAITNVSDLFRKQNIGDKTVNSVTFSNNLAYLSCGFGIAVFDTQTLEFKDTYIIGPNATNLFVYQVALSGTDIYAATKSGLYKAPLSSPNLSSFTSWSKVTGLPAGPYNGVVYFGNNVITNYSVYIKSNQTLAQDTLFQFDGISWSKFAGKPTVLAPTGSYIVTKMSVSQDQSQFITLDQWGFESFSTSAAVIGRIWSLPDGNWHAFADVIADPTQTDWYWIADPTYGLIKAQSQATVSSTALAMENYQINGPANSSAAGIAIKDKKVIVAPSFLDLGMFNTYNQFMPYVFSDNNWKLATKVDTAPIFDITGVAFDPNDKNHFFASAWWDGMIEYTNDAEVKRFDYSNTGSQLHQTDFANSTVTRVGTVVFDKEGNLWAGMGETQHLLSAKKAGTNTWVSLDFSNINVVGSISGPLPRVSKLIVDTNKQVWALAYGVGLFVYKFDGSFTPPTPANAKKLTNITGQGALASNEVISIAEDKNGDIWVGTDKGISVFYNPESIFTQSSGWDAQPIYIQQDGKTQLLLQTEEVSCITVDGANNKWCGTRSGGLYCFSEDGQKQLFHLTTDNSPLFSNAIVDVKIDPETGEVLIATDKGMLSFQNVITEGHENFENVYTYPNPVKADYHGPILIHGMINGAVVKIVDVAGNFVFETTARGGQALWEGKNFSGQRVASGVYMVLCATANGDQKVMTKILLLN